MQDLNDLYFYAQVVDHGGGRALLSGMSRQFGWRSFLLTVAIATSPAPILVLAGLLSMEPLMEHHGFCA